MKHKADGLYYGTLEMLESSGTACLPGLGEAASTLGISMTEHVVLTYASVRRMQRAIPHRDIAWRISRALMERGRISRVEHVSIINRELNSASAARALMDVLYVMAQRDGLVKE